MKKITFLLMLIPALSFGQDVSQPVPMNNENIVQAGLHLEKASNNMAQTIVFGFIGAGMNTLAATNVVSDRPSKMIFYGLGGTCLAIGFSLRISSIVNINRAGKRLRGVRP